MKTEDVIRYEKQHKRHKEQKIKNHQAIKKARHAKRKMPNNW